MSQKVDTTQTSDTSDVSVTVVRGFYETLLLGKVEAILDLLDPQVEWRAPQSLPWGGVFHGHEGFREFFGKLFGQPVDSRREVREYLRAATESLYVCAWSVGARGVKPRSRFPRSTSGRYGMERSSVLKRTSTPQCSWGH